MPLGISKQKGTFPFPYCIFQAWMCQAKGRCCTPRRTQEHDMNHTKDQQAQSVHFNGPASVTLETCVNWIF